jgi:hypothetical protein
MRTFDFGGRGREVDRVNWSTQASIWWIPKARVEDLVSKLQMLSITLDFSFRQSPIRFYVKAVFRSSPWTLKIWRKNTGSSISWKGSTLLKINVQDLGAAQAASPRHWKYLARVSRDQAKGKSRQYRKGKDPKKKPSLRPRTASSRSGAKADQEERRLHLLLSPTRSQRRQP